MSKRRLFGPTELNFKKKYSFVSSKVKSFAKLKGAGQFALKRKYAKLIKRMLGV